jgi:fatty-acyl-CoA synthase
MSLYQTDWIAKWAVYSPNKPAVGEAETGRVFTYRDLNCLGNRMAHRLLQQEGLKKGDRIAILAENCLEYIVLFSAIQKTGLVMVPMNYRLAGAEIDYLLQNAAPKLVIAEEKFEAVLQDAPTYQEIPNKWSLNDFRAWCDPSKETPEDTVAPEIELREDDPAFILYTSGTTGFPKGALYTHKMLFWNSINTAMSLILNSETRTINVMPPFHTGGWNVLTTPILHHGGYTHLMKKFDPAQVLSLLQEQEVTIFMGVPTMLKMIADEEGFEAADFSDLYYIIVGGESMPIPLIERWHEKEVPIRQGYGMTEVGPNLTSLHQDDAIRKKGSIGRPNFYVNIRIVDQDGQDKGINEPGELWLKGPMVMPGYYQNEAATQQSIRDGWFATGDMVRQDEEGYLYVVDRIKNMFISGGENVYPAEVERVIIQHPAVAEVAVIGIPHEKWGEVGKAFIVAASGAHPDTEALIGFCKKRLAKFKVPKEIIVVEELPKNDTGKINRKALPK